MKISYKTDYIMKVLLDLSLNFGQDPVRIENISVRQDIPKKFLEQILVELKKAGFVESKKGPNGGYILAKRPEDITLAQVMKFVDGSIYPISCADKNQKQSCGDYTRCVFVPIWKGLGDLTAQYLDGINFQKLAEDARKKINKEVLNYVI